MAKKPLVEKKDEDIYSDEQREEALEEDEITPEEAGFMEGHEDLEVAECAECGKDIDSEKLIERVVKGKTLWFCSMKCAELFDKRKEHD